VGELRATFGDRWSRMLSCEFVPFPWVTCVVDSRRVSYALWTLSYAFVPFSWVTGVVDAECASYALCLVTLVADVELRRRAFSLGHLCSGLQMGGLRVMFGDVGSRVSSCAFVHFPWVTCAVDSRWVNYVLRLVTVGRGC
jgi:hypothetical protein